MVLSYVVKPEKFVGVNRSKAPSVISTNCFPTLQLLREAIEECIEAYTTFRQD